MPPSSRRPVPAADIIPGFAALLAAHTSGAAVLTRRGLAMVQQTLAPAPERKGTSPRPKSGPTWDRMRRRLCLDDREVRTFKRLAPRQMAVLNALQDGGWPEDGVRNPFRRMVGKELASNRLHQTVVNLNRRLASQGLRIREDGDRVWWERIERP
jgi:hypothetical protein